VNETSLQTKNVPANLTARFWPVVVSGAPAENLYYCMPETDGVDAMAGDALLLAGSTERILDQALMTSNLSKMLDQVERFLGKYSVDGKSVTAIVPINVLGLGLGSFANVFAEKCQAMHNSSDGNLVFELFNFPEKLSLDYLDNLSITVFPFCRHYIARPRPGWTNFTIFTNCNFQGVSFHLMDKAWPAAQIKPHLQTFCASAGGGRLDTYGHGVANEGIGDAARSAGFKYLNGTGVRGAIG
jgi:hypothetical protein